MKADSWRLLIYTVPSEPSRKRAFIWRELKKAGAVYLRDGVAALPDRPASANIIAAIAAKIEGFGGEATVVPGVSLPRARAAALIEASRSARAQEYADAALESRQLLDHVELESEHRELTFADLERIEGDVAKLRQWLGQIAARDWFSSGQEAAVERLLKSCDEVLAAFTDRAASLEAGR
jgi:ChrB-like protein